MIKRSAFTGLVIGWFVPILAVPFVTLAQSTGPATESMSGFSEAIRLEEQLSTESRQWERQKRVLENEIDVLTTELAETKRLIEEIQSQRSDARQRREELLTQLAIEQDLSHELLKLVSTLAAPTSTLLQSLPLWSENWSESPEPITESTPPIELLRLIQQIQAENQRTSTRPYEIDDPDSGETYRVDLLTFGLGAGYFASENGQFGGQIVYDGSTWSAEIIPDYAPVIRNAINQEAGQSEPQYIQLPISVNPAR